MKLLRSLVVAFVGSAIGIGIAYAIAPDSPPHVMYVEGQRATLHFGDLTIEARVVSIDGVNVFLDVESVEGGA